MSSSLSAPVDWRSCLLALDPIRQALRELPGIVDFKVESMGNKEDCWAIYGVYNVARLQIFRLALFPKRRWLQVCCQVTPEGGVRYELYGSDFPVLVPGWSGDSFDELLEQIKTL